MATHFNTNSPAVKRILKEAKELRHPTDQYFATPLSDSNIFEWHFTVRGPPDSDFAGGRFHGRIVLPHDYPMKPPAIYLLTPNGRFEINKKICLTVSDYHPEHWQPSWSIRTVLLALIGFMPSEGLGAIGALDYPPADRQALAARSLLWVCPSCGACMTSALAEGTAALPLTESDLEFMRQVNFKGERERAVSEPGAAASAAAADAAAPPLLPSPVASDESLSAPTVMRQASVGDSIMPRAAPSVAHGPVATVATVVEATVAAASVPASVPAAASATTATPVLGAPSEWAWNAVIIVLIALIAAFLMRVASRPAVL